MILKLGVKNMRYNGCNVYRFQSDAPIDKLTSGYYHLWSVWEKGYEWLELQWYCYDLVNRRKKKVTEIKIKDGTITWDYAGVVMVYNNKIKKVKDFGY